MTTTVKPMAPEAFAAWLAHMKERRGWSAIECCRRLGCGVTMARAWTKRPAPHYIAIACAGLAVEITPWDRR